MQRILAFIAAVALATAIAAPASAAARKMVVPAHGATLDVSIQVGKGEGPRPVLVVFHGFPGAADAPDLSEFTDKGWTVVYPHYRGIWGSTGEFGIANSEADGKAVVAWLRSRATELSIDPGRIGVIGMSYGGWVALRVAAADPSIVCTAGMTPADMGFIGSRWAAEPAYRAFWLADVASLATHPKKPLRLGAAGPDGFLDEAARNAVSFGLRASATAFAGRPVFLSGGSKDDVTPFAEHYLPLSQALRDAGARLTAIELPMGHESSSVDSAALVAWVEANCGGAPATAG